MESHSSSSHFHHPQSHPLNGDTSIHTVLINLVERLVEILKKAEELPKYPHQKSHVPFWAWMCFLACGILCVFMTIGLCWIRSTTRRSSQRGKPGIVATAGRSWKAGFGGGIYDL
uniref:Transmembrane protein n=1 Tax=Panagrolaimus superbus TaxID=310955 RepID=A0A914YW17_9BILA